VNETALITYLLEYAGSDPPTKRWGHCGMLDAEKLRTGPFPVLVHKFTAAVASYARPSGRTECHLRNILVGGTLRDSRADLTNEFDVDDNRCPAHRRPNVGGHKRPVDGDKNSGDVVFLRRGPKNQSGAQPAVGNISKLIPSLEQRFVRRYFSFNTSGPIDQALS